MKLLRYINYTLLSYLTIGVLLFTSCLEDEDGIPLVSPNGEPSISYIRVTNPDASDSLLVSAELGAGIAIVGKNLGGIREAWFNDRQADLTPTWVTNQSILVSVPNKAPLNITNKIYLVDEKGDTLVHDFQVNIPAPIVLSARNEWPQEGESLIINGNYFFDVDGQVPVVVTFEGGVESEAVVVNQNQLDVPVPDGAVEGPVTVTTNFGSSKSPFHVWDSRNIVLNFDDLMPNGWRIGLQEDTDMPIDGNYNVFRENIDANQRVEGPGAPSASPLMFEYWGGSDANRTENFYPLFPGSYKQYTLKFEAKVNQWYGGVLNLCLAPPDHTGSNQEVWGNDLNARAIWAPWSEENAAFSTNGQWVTVVIPLTEFQYYMGQPATDVEYTSGKEFVETAVGSISMWLLGSPENDGNAVEFYIDNVRFVEN